MKIGVVGCGALGGYYGATLLRSGQEVHFLLRSDFAVVRQRGLEVRSPDGDFHVQPLCAQDPREIGECDLAIVALKTTANTELGHLLPPLVGPSTTVLTLQNGLGNEEQLAALFGPERVLGGLCFVCLNRVAPGIVQHFGFGRVVLGEYQRPAQARTQSIGELFRSAGIVCKVTDNLEAAHWEKLVWNIPFNGLGVAGSAGGDAVRKGELNPGAPLAACLTTAQLLEAAEWENLVRELMLEVVQVARALGHDVSEAIVEKMIERTRSLGSYKASSLIDFERGRPMELESLFLRPLEKARQCGANTPRLETLYRILQLLNGRTHDR